ncbi:MAG TPA: RDD family protein [Nitrolancea sp.]|nr:RDD family protein [Nitrolancea sp.]
MDPSQTYERYQFETPEQIDVAYDLAGIGSRFIAALLDTIILSITFLIILIPGTFGVTFVIKLILSAFGHESGGGLELWVLAGTGLLSFFVLAFYYVLFEAFWHGQTPGKRKLGVRVIREGGHPLNFPASMTRNLIRLIDFLPLYYVIGIVVIFIDPKSRRLGDLAAGTVVIKEQKDVKLDTLEIDTRLPQTFAFDTTDQPRLPIRDAHRLDADDRRLLREYLQRRPSLPPDAADRIAGSLARAFALKLHHDLDGELPERFLMRLARAIEEED